MLRVTHSEHSLFGLNILAPFCFHFQVTDWLSRDLSPGTRQEALSSTSDARAIYDASVLRGSGVAKRFVDSDNNKLTV